MQVVNVGGRALTPPVGAAPRDSQVPIRSLRSPLRSAPEVAVL